MACMYKQNQKIKWKRAEGKTVQQISLNSQIMLNEKNCTLNTQNTISLSTEQFN